MKLRVDVRYLRDDGWEEVGLVDYPAGVKPKTPTLFLSALCRTRKDRKWFERTVTALTRKKKPKS